MVKREYIAREDALSHPFANGKYDRKNANNDFILGHESYKEWLEDLPAFTEQEVVKPYLEKLKSKMKERDEDNGGEPLNAVDRGYHLAYEHLCKEIDNLISKGEG